MDIRDSQRIKEIRDNTAKMADAFTRIADALECLADRKTEPTISKMEQVDKDINVRSKDELQKWETPPKFEHKGITTTCVNVMASRLEYEPQTPMCETCRYDEPNNPKCDECIVGEDKPSNYEPQTDCAWK